MHHCGQDSGVELLEQKHGHRNQRMAWTEHEHETGEGQDKWRERPVPGKDGIQQPKWVRDPDFYFHQPWTRILYISQLPIKNQQ